MDLNDFKNVLSQYESELKDIKAENSDLIDEFHNIKDKIRTHSLTSEQKTTVINLLMTIIESKLTNHSKRIKLTENFVNQNFLKRISADANTTAAPDTDYIDTKLLSKKLNKFLTEYNITQTLFNREIAGMIQLRFHLFLKNPLEWSQYQDKTKKHIIKIYEFINDAEKTKRFLARYTNGSHKSDYIDTKLLAKRVNSFLGDNNITQAFFNREIAGMNSICFHMFVKRPSEWSQYRDLTRKKLEAIDQFLKDEEKVESFLEKYRKKAFKRGVKSAKPAHSQEQDVPAVVATGESRFNFTQMQLQQLNNVFLNNHYPTVEFIEYLANSLNVNANDIADWFTMTRGDDDGIIKDELLSSSEYVAASVNGIDESEFLNDRVNSL